MPSGSRTLIVSGGIDPVLSQLRTNTPIEIVSAVIPVTARSAVDMSFTGNLEIGEGADVQANGGIALGSFVAGTTGGPRAIGANSIAIGAGGASPDNSPVAESADGIAIGRGSIAGTAAAQTACVAIGRQAIGAGAIAQIAIGNAASAQGASAGAIAIGFSANAGGSGDCIVIGPSAVAGFDVSNIAIGRLASVQSLRAVGIGRSATVSTAAPEGVAVGAFASVTDDNGVALGPDTSVTAINGVAIGQGALADVLDRGHIAIAELFLGRGVTRNKILSTRVAGWTAATGTATRTTFDTATVTLAVLAEHVKALLDDLGLGAVSPQHGLIGT